MKSTSQVERETSSVVLRTIGGHPLKRPLTIALIGPPGAGKTAVMEATIADLRGKARVAAIIANPAAERDADRVARHCDHVESVRSASPDAAQLRPAISRIDPDQTDMLLIESLGGIGGARDLGQHFTVTVLSVSGGDDKAAEYANLIRASQALLLSKVELEGQVAFDRPAFLAEVKRINPNLEVFEISAFRKTGVAGWLKWLDQRRQEVDPTYRVALQGPEASEWFVG